MEITLIDNSEKTLKEDLLVENNKIAILEKQTKNKKQPSKKFEIFEEIKKLKIEVEKNEQIKDALNK